MNKTGINFCQKFTGIILWENKKTFIIFAMLTVKLQYEKHEHYAFCLECLLLCDQSEANKPQK